MTRCACGSSATDPGSSIARPTRETQLRRGPLRALLAWLILLGGLLATWYGLRLLASNEEKAREAQLASELSDMRQTVFTNLQTYDRSLDDIAASLPLTGDVAPSLQRAFNNQQQRPVAFDALALALPTTSAGAAAAQTTNIRHVSSTLAAIDGLKGVALDRFWQGTVATPAQNYRPVGLRVIRLEDILRDLGQDTRSKVVLAKPIVRHDPDQARTDSPAKVFGFIVGVVSSANLLASEVKAVSYRTPISRELFVGESANQSYVLHSTYLPEGSLGAGEVAHSHAGVMTYDGQKFALRATHHGTSPWSWRNPRTSMLALVGTLLSVLGFALTRGLMQGGPIPSQTQTAAGEPPATDERYLSLIDAAREVVFELDGERRWTFLNAAWTAVTGHDVAEALGKDMLAYANPADHFELKEFFNTLLAAGDTSLSHQIQLLTKSGDYRWIELSARAVVDRSGAVTGLRGTFADVSDRRRTDALLRESEERYTRILEGSSEAILLIDADNQILQANNRVAQVFGYAPEELVGKELSLLQPPELAAAHTRSMRRYLATGNKRLDQRTLSTMAVRKDGAQVPIEITLSYLQRGGEPLFAGFVRDVSERVQAEANLKESQERYELALSASSDGVWYHNLETNQVSFSRRWRDLLGFSEEELPDSLESFNRLLHPDDVARVREAFLKHVKQRQPYQLEIRVRAKSGEYHWFSVRGQAAWDASGRATRLAGSANDISARKVAEFELQKVNEQLNQTVSVLQQRTNELSLLREMGDLMQNCRDVQEASRIVGDFARRLFGAASGGVFLLDSQRDMLESEIVWGNIERSEQIFQTADCWALRRVKPNLADTNHSTLHCAHVNRPTEGGYLCVPLAAQGEAIGILHLRDAGRDADRRLAAKRELAILVAEQVGLALGSLKLRESLRSQSVRDPLTGLFNRRYLEETLAREERRALRAGSSIGVILFDVDNFKRLNDTFGHDAGDKVLRSLGGVLQAQVRDADIACRYGGEEFILALPGAGLEVTRERAEALRTEAQQLHVSIPGQALPSVSISVGVAVFPDHGATWRTAIQEADRALYRAKQGGRNRVVIAA